MTAPGDASTAVSSAASAANPEPQWRICAANDYGNVYFLPPSLSDATVQRRLDDTLREITDAHAVPSLAASNAFTDLVEKRLIIDCFALSCTLDWHSCRLYCDEAWSVRCSERAAAQVCSKLYDRANIMYTSEAAWDDASYLFFMHDKASEQEVRVIVAAFTRDVHADEELTRVLRTRCGLGVVEASNWLVERDPQWPSK